MGVTALWTAVHYKIPLLFVLANNRSFYNDELHQERMARMRNRPVENKWIGQRMSEPDVDLAAMGRAQGAAGFGPVTKPADLAAALEKAIAAVDAGQVAVVDVRVEPGYSAGHDRSHDAKQKLECPLHRKLISLIPAQAGSQTRSPLSPGTSGQLTD